MNSVILCEGFDDLWFLGYLLHKWSGGAWNHKPNEKLLGSYALPVRARNEQYEIYRRDSDILAIWAIGGKDKFINALEEIDKINKHQRDDILENIVIVSDRDENEIDVTLSPLERKLRNLGLTITLVNDSKNRATYTVDGDLYEIYVSPIMIPFDENGALETILMTAISGVSDEDAYVVEQAKKYVSTVYECEKTKKYLQHIRERVKAEFSSVVSITNPTKSTASFNDLLMSHNWEENEYIKSHFRLLREIFIEK